MIPIAFLIISIISLAVHVVVLTKVWGGPPGLPRTAVCRVIASILYVCLGVFALLHDVGVEALLVFGFVQALWHINAIADVRLRRKEIKEPKHRPPR